MITSDRFTHPVPALDKRHSAAFKNKIPVREDITYNYNNPSLDVKVFFAPAEEGAETTLARADEELCQNRHIYPGVFSIRLSRRFPVDLFITASEKNQVAKLLDIPQDSIITLRTDTFGLLSEGYNFPGMAWVVLLLFDGGVATKTKGCITKADGFFQRGQMEVLMLPVNSNGDLVEMSVDVAKRMWGNEAIEVDGAEYRVMENGVAVREFFGGLERRTISVCQIDRMGCDLSAPELHIFSKSFKDHPDDTRWIHAQYQRLEFLVSSYNLPAPKALVKLLSGDLTGHVAEYIGPTQDSLTHIDVMIGGEEQFSTPIHCVQLSPTIMDRVQYRELDGSRACGWVVNTTHGGYLVRPDKEPSLILHFLPAQIGFAQTTVCDEDL
ncbi:hypothetical protein DFP72DRAFT_1170148 [Ephemerocybe angulata]|uniref:Uncharacterized protein n=1 Tax=Ephemerocybe angulata TaxID=980116 RepID=A0A8H6HWU0_9AGAR|nr:hypothetical protein DFP72DRAFT_1170148 [Tulosesus angulatus]